MTAWRVARSLDVLLAQLNAAHPRRSRASDGSIGDAAHASRDSDHNAWVDIPGEDANAVTARDYTDDPRGGVDTAVLAEQLRASRDRRVKYVICDGRIMSGAGGRQPWQWRPYRGANAHTKHLHLSVMADAALFDDDRRWALPMLGDRKVAVPTTPRQPAGVRPLSLKTPHLRGADVAVLQRALRVADDGIFGPATDRALRVYQHANRLSVDGIVGPQVRRALRL